MRSPALLAALLGSTTALVSAADLPSTPGHEGASQAFRGLFQYLADAPLFTDCRTGKAYPIGREGAYPELERAYLATRQTPGGSALVHLFGHLTHQPSPDGPGDRETLVVDRLEGPVSTAGCEPSAPPLTEVRWRLIELAGIPLPLKHPERTPELRLAAGGTASGYSGCNRFRGRFQQEGETLRFSSLAGTLRACLEEAALEKGFFDALDRTDGFQIRDGILELRAGTTPLAQFRAEPSDPSRHPVPSREPYP